MTTEYQVLETTDHDETIRAINRAVELLERAVAELASAEAFAETGTTGRMRLEVIQKLKSARNSACMAARKAGWARDRAY